MRLTLHIGLGKTGTSSLQTFLIREAALLKRHGIFVPGLNLGKLKAGAKLPHQGAINNEEVLARSLRALDAKARTLRGIKEVVWSNESLSMGFNRHEIAPKIKALLEGSDVFTEVKILIVVRRQDEWIESAYRQWALKHKVSPEREILSPEAYRTKVARVMDYLALHDSWAVFGEDNIRLVTYDEVRVGRGIIDWFCAQKGIEYLDRFDQYGKANTSLGVAQSYFMSVYARGFQRSVLPGEFRPLIRAYNLPEISPKGSAFYSNEMRANIMEDYADSNRRLAQKVFSRDDLFPNTEPRMVIPYTTGEQDAATYLAIIAKRQHDMITARAKPAGKPVAPRTNVAPPEKKGLLTRIARRLLEKLS